MPGGKTWAANAELGAGIYKNGDTLCKRIALTAVACMTQLPLQACVAAYMHCVSQMAVQLQFLAPYTAPGIALFAFKAASSSTGRPVPVTSLPTVTQ